MSKWQLLSEMCQTSVCTPQTFRLVTLCTSLLSDKMNFCLERFNLVNCPFDQYAIGQLSAPALHNESIWKFLEWVPDKISPEYLYFFKKSINRVLNKNGVYILKTYIFYKNLKKFRVC